MFDFGDEFVIENYRIPWLLWIQLLVMFLLIILLYYFSSSPLDLSHPSAAVPLTSAAGSSCLTNGSSLLAGPDSGSLCNSKVGENEMNRETGTSRGVGGGISKKEDIQEMEEFSTMDGAHFALFGRPQHPCNFLGAATQAFLKCLGLDSSSSSDSSSTRKPTKKHSCVGSIITGVSYIDGKME